MGNFYSRTVMVTLGDKTPNECTCSNCDWLCHVICAGKKRLECLNDEKMNPIGAPDIWFCADWKEQNTKGV